MKRFLRGIFLMTALGLVGYAMGHTGHMPWTWSASIAHAQVPPPPAPAAPAPAPTAPAPAPGAAPAGPLATADGETPGLRVDVTQLKRDSGGTVTLKFTLVNDSDTEIGMTNYMTASDYNTVSGVHLIDPVGKKKYFVVRDTEKTCVCSRSIGTVEAKTSANYWAKFPAPPETVEKISVVIPHFGPLDDVPISR